MRFSTCTAANHVRFCRDQSTAQKPEGRTERRRCAMTGAFVHVGGLHAKPLRAARSEKRGRVVDVHDGHARIVFVVPALKERRDGELLHARNESRRRHVAFGHEKRHLVARTHPKRVGEVAPENHAEASGFEHRQFGAAPQLRSEVAHGPFRRGIDPLHDGPSHRAPGTQQSLSGHVRRGRDDARHLKDGVRKRMPALRAPRGPITSMCGTTLSMRSRTSF